MEHNFVIEEVTTFSPSIAEAVRTLVLQLSSDAVVLSDADLTSLIESSTSFLFIAKETTTQTIVGMVTLISYRIPYTVKGVIEDLVVDEAYRGNGLGEKLLVSAIEKAKLQGVKSLMLTSKPSRIAANKLYQRLGFEQYQTNVYKVQL